MGFRYFFRNSPHKTPSRMVPPHPCSIRKSTICIQGRSVEMNASRVARQELLWRYKSLEFWGLTKAGKTLIAPGSDG
jgi:hypothetical protein